MSRGRVTIFLIVALSVWAILHLYVFWRVTSVPWVAVHVSHGQLVLATFLLWASYPLARLLTAKHLTTVGVPLEFLGATWVGMLFLLFSALLVTDVVTVGGLLLPIMAPTLRGWAIIIAGALAIVGLAQGLRPPVVRDYEVRLAGLPQERDGLVVVVISDVHLGNLIGNGWMTRLVNRVNEMRPDLIVVAGDLVDGEVGQVEPFLPILRDMKAPLGVWAVTGNHEYYAGIEHSVAIFQKAGYSVLRNRSIEVVPGLVLAGVDDLTARSQFGNGGQPLENALPNRPIGTTLLLSHSPLQTDAAAKKGVGLMLSAHTHNGQIWPFNYLVRLRYPLMGGRYEVDGMTVVVCRGTGTWGPRMRLWLPNEMLRIRLRAESQFKKI